ncbi:MAG TPA: hypothetical protein VKW06_22880 [Candidatus Angelobacter sp.]|nr:hypothetical protein [Candidatus Angelobacter sp.]
MALLDAKEYDPRPAERRKRLIIIGVIIVVVATATWWFTRYWPEEHVVNKFFEAIERKDFDAAYGIYYADPDWKQHPQKYSQYSLNQFVLDWGPSSEYGVITSHKIDCLKEPEKKDFSSPSGVIIAVTLNNRTDDTSMWVEKKTKTLTTSPFPLLCHPPK